MVVELLRLAGGEGADLVRRWVAALLIAPPDERAEIVGAVEAKIVSLYAGVSSSAEPEPERLVHIAGDPVARSGHTEVVVRSFAAGPVKAACESNHGDSKQAG